MNRKLKYGMIGCGGIATSKHFTGMREIADLADLVAVCDLIEERAIAAAKEFNISDENIYTDYKELLKDESIDVVLVLTPNISHSTISVDAMNAGKHVLCEKPMAINSVEARKMIEASKQTGMKLTIGYQNRYRQDSTYLKEVCKDKGLGEIYYAKAHAVRRKGVPTWGVFTDEEKQGGGPLIDIGTHALDLTLWMMDNYEPHMVVGTTYNKLSNKPDGNSFGPWDELDFTVEDSAFGFIVMKNGATISLESSWALNTRFNNEATCSLHGTEGGADMIDGLWINKAQYGKLVDEKVNTEIGGVPFFDGVVPHNEGYEARIFAENILNDTPLCVEPHQAYTVTLILEAIYESAKSGKPVYL